MRGLGAIVAAALLAVGTAAWAQDEAVEADTHDDAADVDTHDDPADTEAPADEAVGKCVTKCESEHDTCEATAKAKAEGCDRQKAVCDAGCARCARMKGGPNVVYCVNDCDRCRNQYARSPCAKPAAADTDCAAALDACLERCGP